MTPPLAALLLYGGVALGHPALSSALRLDVGVDAVDVELQLPADQLAMARERRADPVDPLPGPEVLAPWVASHVHLDDARGTALVGTVTGQRWAQIDGASHLVVTLRFDVPPEADLSTLWVEDDAISSVVASHKTWVTWGTDVAMGRLDAAPVVVGVVSSTVPALRVDRVGAGPMRGLRAAFALGAVHIAEGTDHLLFLLTLLLAAPLVAVRGHWAPRDDARAAVGRVLAIVTAFTVGHSVTLALGAVGAAALPGAVVESAIALSILVSAIHALRPLRVGGEAWIAGAFGLLHGLAFASALAGIGVDRLSLVTALVGFNLGIEAAQLAVVAVTVPALLVLARGPFGTAWRGLAAGGAIVASTAWLAERALGVTNPVAPWVDGLRDHALVAVVLLYLLAALGSVRGAGRTTMGAGVEA